MKVDIYNTDKKYNIIYADPPWHYRTWRDGQGTAEKHYPTMKIEEIIAMKDTIQKISDKDCVLFFMGYISMFNRWIKNYEGMGI